MFGLEAQGDWADLKGSNQSILVPGLFTNEPKMDAFGLFTGQVGWAANNVLCYAARRSPTFTSGSSSPPRCADCQQQ